MQVWFFIQLIVLFRTKWSNFKFLRSLPIEYSKDNVVDGFNTYEYHLPKDVFYNSSLNPSNKGLCEECLGNGVQEIGQCSNDAPAYASLPHFLNADEKFIDAVDGLNPNSKKHDFVFNFEPVMI